MNAPAPVPFRDDDEGRPECRVSVSGNNRDMD